jgi:O-antigen/teichoic acid export membrane protein
VNRIRTGAFDARSRARIEERLWTNTGLSLATRIVTAALSLTAIPVVVARLGLASFGTWEALLACASLVLIVQTAVSGTLVWRISDAYGQHDAATIHRMTGLGVTASLGVFVVLWPVMWWLREPVVRFLGVSAESHALAAQIFPIASAFVLIAGLSQTLEAVVSGCQRAGLVNVVAAVAQILNYSVVIVAVVLGAGLWGLVAGHAAGSVARLVGAWIAARAAFGAVSLKPRLPGRIRLSRARYPGLLMVGSIAAALREQTDKVILAALGSTSWVAYYGIAARLANLVTEVISFVYVPILTAAGALNGMGDWDGVRMLYRRLMATVSIATGLIVVVVAGLADSLVILWFGQQMPEVRLLLWILLTGGATAVMLTGPGTAICRGVGRVAIETTYLTFNLVLNVVLTVVLVLAIGPIGTAVATGSTWAVSSILFLFVMHRNLDLPAVASRRAVATAMLAAVLALTVSAASRAVGLPEGRAGAFLYLVVGGSSSALIYFGLTSAFRLVSLQEACTGLRSLLRRAERA